VEQSLRALEDRDKVLDDPERQSQLKVVDQLRPAPRGLALPVASAAEGQRDNIVKWFVVVALFALAAFVTIAPFIWL
jgi:hypothetical protein